MVLWTMEHIYEENLAQNCMFEDFFIVIAANQEQTEKNPV